MEVAEIVEQLRWFNQRFELDAVKAALASREEVTPALLGILEEVAERGAAFDESDDYMAHLYAMFLLAQFRETRAYPLVLRLASLPGDLSYSLFGDFVTEDLGRVLASVCGGDLAGIQSLIENEDTDQWARGAALSSLVTLVVTGEKSREEIVSYFADLYRGKLARQWSHVWDKLVACSSHIYPAELLADIERAYEEDLVDPGYIGFDDVQGYLALGKDRVLARIARDRLHRLVEDTAQEMSWWACFQDARAKSASPRPANIKPAAMEASQIKNAKPKTGRNDPCPCGSGKKYKKCCGA